MYWGVFIGALLGGLIGHGSPLGVLLGAFIGYHFDKGLRQKNPQQASALSVEQVQQLFFENTFQFMGHLAKADGVVSSQEIQIAKVFMQQLRLSEAQKQQAIAYFRQGRDAPRAHIERDLQQLQQGLCAPEYVDLIQMFLEIQIQVACVDGQIEVEEMRLLQQACHILGFPAHVFQFLLKRILAEYSFLHSGQQQSAGAASSGYGHAQRLQQAYGVLGVDEQASMQDIKRAYRKLMSQHHPDKLVSKGLPQQMIEVAKQKTQEIQSAYDFIYQTRKS